MKQTVVIFLTLLLLSSCGDGRKQFHEPRSEADLSGLTIATSNGTYYHGKFEKRTDVGLYIANTETDALQAVRQGLADVYVTDEIILSQEEMERLNIKLAFRGKETFKMNESKEKFRCMVFSFYEREDGKSHELIRFYITDDQNHIPVRLDMFSI